MTFQEFKGELTYRLNKELPDADVCMREVMKNNDQRLDCVTIREGVGNVAPTIYLNYYYDKICKGETFERVFREILEIYRNNRIEEEMDLSFVADYELVKSKIVFDLVSYEKNQELLKDVPYEVYLDLAIVFRIMLGLGEQEHTSILIHREHLNMWGVTEEDLMEEAVKNTPRILPPEISSMKEALAALMPEEAEFFPDLPMYVLSNSFHMNGAGCILYEDVLKDFANRLDSDLYVLPSSIHEVLLVPANIDTTKQNLSELVMDVNEKEVSEGEILSGHAYYFSRRENALSA